MKLMLTGAVPVLAVIGLLWGFSKDTAQRLNKIQKQIIAGIVFGVTAIIATECGVSYSGTTINVRDSSPLSAGLIFGPYAGIIAGLIGGIERWAAHAWGFTRAGCTIATILAGLIAAALRKYVFEDKVPSAGHAVVIAVVQEVIHMLMIFITNVDVPKAAFAYVEMCTIPMVTANALTLGAAVWAAVWFTEHEKGDKGRLPTLSKVFQNRLVLAVMAGYVGVSVFSYHLQNQIAKDNTSQLFSLNLQDAVIDVMNQCNEMIMQTNRHIASSILSEPDPILEDIKERYGVHEVNIIGASGIIRDSSEQENIGYDISEDSVLTQFREMFMLMGPDEMLLDFLPTDRDPNLSLKYSAVRTTDRQLIQIAYDDEQMSKLMSSLMPTVVSNRHIGENGGLFVMDSEFQIIYYTNGLFFAEDEKEITNAVSRQPGSEEYTLYSMQVEGETYYYMYSRTEDYFLAAVLPESEADFSRNLSLYLNFFLLTIIFGTMFVTIYLIIKNLIVRNIRKVNTSLAAITDGDLNTTVDVRSSREFNDLSDDINETVDTLKRYIAEANARIDAELKTARDIQRSALPNVFPDREEVDLYALMNPAKEVGGDFYDFYFLDRNRLMFLVADVSGKGIPASLFMMRAKTLLKTFAENRMKVNDNFRNANVQLCEGNDAGMFVTAWMGNLNLETGVLHYVNAGHNKPLIRRKNGEYEFLDDKPGFVLAGLETTKYKEQTVVLEPGDELFLYTDGVVEATDANNMLYGNERLLQCANAHIGEDAKTLCESVLADVNAFYNGAPQYDDLTELSVKFLKYAPSRFADERTKSKA